MIYYFGGINGSGKSTLLGEIAKQGNFEVIQLTDRLIQFIGLSNREELRALPQEQNRQQLARLMKALVAEAKDKHLLLDAHYLNLRHGRVAKVTEPWIKDMSALVLVEADVETIYERVQNDPRDRGLLAKELPKEQYIERLGRYQKQTRQEFDRLAQLYNLPSLTIDNNDLEQAGKAFLNFHGRLGG